MSERIHMRAVAAKRFTPTGRDAEAQNEYRETFGKMPGFSLDPEDQDIVCDACHVILLARGRELGIIPNNGDAET